MEKIEVSAKSLALDFKPFGKSLIQIKNRDEPRIEPCGTRDLSPCQSEH